MQIYLDGEWLPRDAAKVSVFDHGLLYGDGVFEGIRVYARRIFRLEQHIDRLYESALGLALDIPLDHAAMCELVREAVRRNQRDDAYIRLVVTRGTGELGIDPTSCPTPSVIVIVDQVRVYSANLYASGIKVITSATRQVPHDSIDPRIKSLNYLKNILAKIDAQRAGAQEAILLNHAGFVAECTADNIFVVRGGRLLTPAVQDGALGGITRGTVMQLAGEIGLPVEEPRLTRFDIYTAAECFVTGTGAELMPVIEADGRPIADGKPGPVTQRLTEVFHALVRRDGAPCF